MERFESKKINGLRLGVPPHGLDNNIQNPGLFCLRLSAPVDQAYTPLAGSAGATLETLSAYLGTGRSLEAAARSLYVHPNTVRYRLRKVAELTGWDPLDARESFVLQVALALGELVRADATQA